MGKKELLARWLYGIGLTRPLEGIGRPSLRILAYHRVYDMIDENSFAADPELVSASVADFRLQMQYIRKYWNPIPLSVAVDVLASGERLPDHCVVVTFDDGHLDNFTLAYPILLEQGIPATIFLSTGYIGGTVPFWFDRVATLLFLAPTGHLHIPLLNLDLGLGDIQSRRAGTARVLTTLKGVPDELRRSAVAALEAELGRHAETADPGLTGVMSWDQVREMAQHGIEFGSHSVSHPILSRLSDAAIFAELMESRQTLERELGREINLLAYPVGKEHAFDSRVVSIARTCGYKAGVAYVDGVNHDGSTDLFSLRRMSVERYYSHASFVARLVMPGVFA